MQTKNTTDKPILIFSPQKCGSTSVMRAIQSAGFDAHRVYEGNMHQFNFSEHTVIVLVREPIAHGISWRFEQRLNDGGTSLPIRIVENMDFFPSIAWYERNEKIVRSADLVLRTRDLDKLLEKSLRKLIDANTAFTVEHLARGDDRFGRLYPYYVENIFIDPELVYKVYDTPYARTWWSSMEREKLVKKWTRL